MMPNSFDDAGLLRCEIAAAAARLIAQDGADYDSAKRKAARQILGDGQPRPNQLPDDEQIEEELRRYNALFLSDTQPARLFRLRSIALQVMEALEQFKPYLCGAVLNGTAGQHDDIRLQLFADNTKDVVLFLLNKNVQIEFSETPHFKGPRYDPVETVSFLWANEGVHAELYDLDDLRGARKLRADGKILRCDSAGLRALLPSTSCSSQ
jgi:hypothetical protein